MSVELAIIGGTGVYDLVALEDAEDLQLDTPFGPPSSSIRRGRWGNRRVAFLPRHGTGHSVLPHQVNYRANLQALSQLKPQAVIGINAVGSMDKRCPPGAVTLPDQIIDYTHGRETTFFGSEVEVPIHIDFTEPFSPEMRGRLIAAADGRFAVSEDLVLGVCQGPRLETAAEIRRLQNDGANLVGMTTMPEACLARELGFEFASICIVANWGAGFRPDVEEITFDDVREMVKAATDEVIAIIGDL